MITSDDAISVKPFMPIEDFISEGYMQEVNRRFLHPLGLALVGSVREHGHELWVIDSRDEPGGIYYEQDSETYSETRRRAAEEISRQWSEHGGHRMREARYMIQPMEML